MKYCFGNDDDGTNNNDVNSNNNNNDNNNKIDKKNKIKRSFLMFIWTIHCNSQVTSITLKTKITLSLEPMVFLYFHMIY